MIRRKQPRRAAVARPMPMLLVLMAMIASSARPCSSASSTTTTTSMYEENTLRSGGTLVYLVTGTIAGVAMLLGLLFLVDREAFHVVTCKDGRSRVCCASSSSSPDSSQDFDDGGGASSCCHAGGDDGGGISASHSTTPYEQDVREEYLTEETAEYLAEKRDGEAKWMARAMRHVFPWCVPPTTAMMMMTTRHAGDGDKYATDPGGGGGGAASGGGGDGLGDDGLGDDDEDGSGDLAATQMRTGIRLLGMGAINSLASIAGGVRSRFLWLMSDDRRGPPCGAACARHSSKRSAHYPDLDTDGMDKYYVGGDSESESCGGVRYAASSYESAASKDTIPW